MYINCLFQGGNVSGEPVHTPASQRNSILQRHTASRQPSYAGHHSGAGSGSTQTDSHYSNLTGRDPVEKRVGGQG